MNEDKPERVLHPAHHWGAFADDPWNEHLDAVTGEVWEEVVRRSMRSRQGSGALDLQVPEPAKVQPARK